MRAALCMLVILLGFTSLACAQNASDKDKYKNEKRYRVPDFDLSGFNARFSADQSSLGQMPDPGSQYKSRIDTESPVFGLTITRPVPF